MTQYKLLKDLPGHIAGVVFEEDWDGTPKSSSLNYLMRDFPAWFEPVLPHPPAKETYVLVLTHAYSDDKSLVYESLDLAPDAAEALAKAIEALLERIQSPEDIINDPKFTTLYHYTDLVENARKAIQDGSAA